MADWAFINSLHYIMDLSLLPFQPSVLIINVFFSLYSATKRVFGCSWPQQIKRWLMHASCSLIFTKNLGKVSTPVLTCFTCLLSGCCSNQVQPCVCTAFLMWIASPFLSVKGFQKSYGSNKTISKLGGFFFNSILSYHLKWSVILIKITQIDCSSLSKMCYIFQCLIAFCLI